MFKEKARASGLFHDGIANCQLSDR